VLPSSVDGAGAGGGQRDIHKNAFRPSCNNVRCICLIVADIEFFRQFSVKLADIKLATKIHPAGADFFHTDGHAYITKLTGAFWNSRELVKRKSSKSDKYITELSLLKGSNRNQAMSLYTTLSIQ
jgi:hypothetical protein